jgi:electron transfer flavoprotein beta subunit
VSAATIDDGVLTADRDLEDGVQSVRVPLPAIVSVAEEAFLPRRVTLLQAMKAQKMPNNAWDIEGDLGLSRETLDAVAGYSVVAESGIVVDRKQRVLKGLELAEMADLLIDALVDENVLALKGSA